jgi:hypothetical protein
MRFVLHGRISAICSDAASEALGSTVSSESRVWSELTFERLDQWPLGESREETSSPT